MQADWTTLTPEQKRAERLRKWMEPPETDFASPEAAAAYKARVTRLTKAINLEVPDRVPVMLPVGSFPLHYAGMTLKQGMYDNHAVVRAYRQFIKEFDIGDTGTGAMVMSGKASEILDSLSSRWPGHGLPDDAQMNQFVEGEYMKADEYDHFLYDCADWCFRRYLPRSLGALAPFATFAPLYDMLGMPNRFVQPAARPDVRAAFQAIIDYGKESEEWMKPLMELGREVYAAGYPSFMGGQAHAPFDILADTLRGTRGIIMDMYRQPDKVMRAIEMLIPMNIDIGVRQANQSGRPFVFFALHKGDDMFMSDEQFEKFYWPGLRAVILGLIEEGIVPYLFAEGKYTNRLRIIKDLPRGKALWHFDQTDMDRAKDILGDVCAITGNVPTSLLVTGTPSQVREYCRHLIEYCGKGGGFILTGGASINRGDPDNLRAMTDAVKEYGVYA